MCAGPGPSFCTAAGCRDLVMRSTQIGHVRSFGRKKLRPSHALFARLHQRTVTAGGGEQGQESENRQREPDGIQRKCLNHKVCAECMLDEQGPHPLEDVSWRERPGDGLEPGWQDSDWVI